MLDLSNLLAHSQMKNINKILVIGLFGCYGFGIVNWYVIGLTSFLLVSLGISLAQRDIEESVGGLRSFTLTIVFVIAAVLIPIWYHLEHKPHNTTYYNAHTRSRLPNR